MKTYFNKRFKIAISIFCFFFIGFSYAQLNLPRGSQMATISQKVGISDVTITYSRPQVKGRKIWGKLVPYGMNDLGFGTAKLAPWRVGANENTTITFSNDAKVEGKPIKKGTYALFMNIKNDHEVNIILSKDATSWGSFFYDKNEVVLTADVKSKKTGFTEYLTFNFNQVTSNSTTVALSWANKEIDFKISFDTNKIVLNDIKQKLKNAPGFNRQTWEQAANYALNNGDYNQALKWINTARTGQFFSKITFANTQIKAAILNKMGNQKDGLKIMNDALPLGTIFEVHAYGRQLISLGLTDQSLEVFKWNAKHHKNTWPVNYGLGRAYAAKGDFKTAIKYLNKSLKIAPTKANKDRVQANIDKLKKGEKIN